MSEITLDTLIEELDLSTRIKNALYIELKCYTLRDVVQNTSERILKRIPNLGPLSILQIKEFLVMNGFQFQSLEPVTLNSDINRLNLKARELHPLMAGGFRTVLELVQATDKELLKCPNFGEICLSNTRKVLYSHGFDIKSKSQENIVLTATKSDSETIPVNVELSGVSIQGNFTITGLQPGQTLTIKIN